MTAHSIIGAISSTVFRGIERAGQFQNCVQGLLERRGWRVEREVVVGDRGDGRRGKVDLVASQAGYRVGIELDNRSPRAKSVHKLRALSCDERLVVLRVRSAPYRVEGVLVLGTEVVT